MNQIKLPIFQTLINDHLELKNPQSENEKKLQTFLHCLADGSAMDDPFFAEALDHIRTENSGEIPDPSGSTKTERLKEYWKYYFPEGLLFFQEKDEIISEIRKLRTVTIEKHNPDPITDVPGEMTFTSNILLTIPDKQTDLNSLDLPEEIRDRLPRIMEEPQLYWFDHPVQMGEIPAGNEIIYGLTGLSEAFAFEKRSGNCSPDARLDVLLSVSVTHEGLQDLAAPYLRYELSGCRGIKDLNIYIFTEKDCSGILEAYSLHSTSISEFFGVDGKYGRHYNFLKAINILWKAAVNPGLKGTFKIDLDQIFPQEKLLETTGKTAFQHFCSPLWGSKALDSNGESVDLSMIAGALVNESDIDNSLYTPDVSLPDLNAPVSDLLFFKHLSMALSTRSELMTRYTGKSEPDGINQALSRIHVTGGTNGILIDALIKYRPFTPAFIGRAEDQAYILSVLNNPATPRLRYYHEDGLIMRHDKHAFAGQSIEAARDGTYIADIMRILYYTFYSKALPGGIDKIKEETYPFTGSYISHFPITLSYMRLISKLLEMYEDGQTQRADLMLELGKSRLQPLINSLLEKNVLLFEYEKEKKQWDLFYGEVEVLSRNSNSKNEEVIQRKKRIADVFRNCLVT